MQTCSNCGSTSREGAKFCTTCGSRLNPVTDPATSGWGSTSTESATTSPTSPEPAAGEHETGSFSTTSDSRPETSSSPGWSWGQTTTASEPAGDTGSEDTTPGEPDTEDRSEDSAPELSSWAKQWDAPVTQDATTLDSSGQDQGDTSAEEAGDQMEAAPGSDDPVTTPDEEPAASTEIVASDDDDDLQARADALSAAVAAFETEHDADADEPEDVITLPGTEPVAAIETREVDDATPASEEAAASTATTTPEPFTFPSFAEESSRVERPAQDRAHELLDALRTIIDDQAAELARTPEPVPAEVDTASSGNSQAALAALQAVPADGERFRDLRQILEKAREHPRDVDTMLDLLGEINSLIALIDSHEAHVNAVRTAIDHLAED